MAIITRFAPSPTWFLHIWSLRTVLYNYLFAKKNKGKFMLRIEDTDKTRFVEWSIKNMLEVLTYVWLIPDEWPNNPWDKWPYYQSKRLDLYKKYINELLKKDKVYYCFCKNDRLTKLRKQQKDLWLITKYDKKCRFLSKEQIKEKLDLKYPYTIRLKVPENKIIEFEDIIKWKIKIPSKDIDEQILLKSDWFPTYHFANVVDDHLMNISHVIRWDEWTPSTAKHVIIYNFFNWQKPIFAHIPLLLWNDKKKLSKRTWDVAVENYIKKWYLSEAIINYIALLWWNTKTTQEFFNINELIEKFELHNVHKSWAIFDIVRLNFFNSHYLKNLNTEYLYEKMLTFLRKYEPYFFKKINWFEKKYNIKIFAQLKTRIKNFSQFKEYTTFFYDNSNIPSKELILNEKMKIDNIAIVEKWLNLTLDILSEKKSDFNSINDIKEIFIKKIKKTQMKNWQVLWPIRCALSWEQFSPWWLEMIYILWINKSIERIKKVLKKIT